MQVRKRWAQVKVEVRVRVQVREWERAWAGLVASDRRAARSSVEPGLRERPEQREPPAPAEPTPPGPAARPAALPAAGAAGLPVLRAPSASAPGHQRRTGIPLRPAG